jgi:hypothetical protein
VRLRGVLDLSLGNFLCLRGFAPMGGLYDISEPDPSIQRNLLHEHRDEMVAFLNQGEFLFFPEVILGTTLSRDVDDANVSQMFEKVRNGENFKRLKFDDFGISASTRRVKKPEEKRAQDVFHVATLDLKKSFRHKFSRIDGNHRLSATPEDPKFRSHNTPFCLIFFRNNVEAARFSRALFHNINYKQIPLTMEHNLRLILDDEDLFPDELLKTSPSFGWPYYLSRRLKNHLDFDLLTNLAPFIEQQPRTFLVQQLKYLIDKGVLGDNENAIRRFKGALGRVNAIFDTCPGLKDSTNTALLAALLYYDLLPSAHVQSFIRWVLENHIHLIRESTPSDLIQIFDKVLESKKRTVFVSMPFGKKVSENHYKIIQRVCSEISTDFDLKPALKVSRVDWFRDGTSYVITDKIEEMVSDCGLLIGNLTCCNPNVYHEIGFVMGKAKTEGKDTPNMLVFLDESVTDDKDKFVGFNLRGIKQLRFTETEEFAKELRDNLERFFKLSTFVQRGMPEDFKGWRPRERGTQRFDTD